MEGGSDFQLFLEKIRSSSRGIPHPNREGEGSTGIGSSSGFNPAWKPWKNLGEEICGKPGRDDKSHLLSLEQIPVVPVEKLLPGNVMMTPGKKKQRGFGDEGGKRHGALWSFHQQTRPNSRSFKQIFIFF